MTSSSLAVATRPRRSSPAAATIPGNFSHVALVYIDSTTHAISVIEAHIERRRGGLELRQVPRRQEAPPDAAAPARGPAGHATGPAPAAPRRQRHAVSCSVRPHPVRFPDGLHGSVTTLLLRGRVVRVPRLGVDLWMRTSTISTPGTAPMARILRRLGTSRRRNPPTSSTIRSSSWSPSGGMVTSSSAIISTMP